MEGRQPVTTRSEESHHAPNALLDSNLQVPQNKWLSLQWSTQHQSSIKHKVCLKYVDRSGIREQANREV
jgi:hypothetical protein